MRVLHNLVWMLVLGSPVAFGGTMPDLTELPPNDFQITTTGTDGSILVFSAVAAVAHNATDNEYLVVFQRDISDAIDESEVEVFGQRIDAATGENIGEAFRISDAGPDDDVQFDVFDPRVAWNGTDNQYLVVWNADDDTGALVDQKFEIYGQLIDGATGAEIGSDFRISQTGADVDDTTDAFDPDVVWNGTDNEYLVVWDADPTGGIFQVYGQRLSAAGAAIAPAFQISDVPNTLTGDGAVFPSAAWNSVENEYLVVWMADPETDGLAAGEFEFFGQLLSSGGAEIGPDDFRISDLGDDGDANFGPPFRASSDVAHSDSANEYMVVFAGDDNRGDLIDEQFQVFGQRISADGAELGTNDVRLSNSLPAGDNLATATNPEIVWNSTENEYLATWEGEDVTGPNLAGIVDPNFNEIYVQRLTSSGGELDEEMVISDAGAENDPTIDAFAPAVAWNSVDNEYLVVWEADDTGGESDFEVFGQLLGFQTVELNGAREWVNYD